MHHIIASALNRGADRNFAAGPSLVFCGSAKFCTYILRKRKLSLHPLPLHCTDGFYFSALPNLLNFEKQLCHISVPIS